MFWSPARLLLQRSAPILRARRSSLHRVGLPAARRLPLAKHSFSGFLVRPEAAVPAGVRLSSSSSSSKAGGGTSDDVGAGKVDARTDSGEPVALGKVPKVGKCVESVRCEMTLVLHVYTLFFRWRKCSLPSPARSAAPATPRSSPSRPTARVSSLSSEKILGEK